MDTFIVFVINGSATQFQPVTVVVIVCWRKSGGSNNYCFFFYLFDGFLLGTGLCKLKIVLIDWICYYQLGNISFNSTFSICFLSPSIGILIVDVNECAFVAFVLLYSINWRICLTNFKLLSLLHIVFRFINFFSGPEKERKSTYLLFLLPWFVISKCSDTLNRCFWRFFQWKLDLSLTKTI